MVNAVLEVVEGTSYVQRSSGLYHVGERVVYKTSFNNGGSPRVVRGLVIGNYGPEEMIEGTVIAAFENNGRMTYRLKLDRVWNDRSDCLYGENIVVGNIFAGRLYEKVLVIE